VRKTVTKCLRECERDMKQCIPREMRGVWNTSDVMSDVRGAINKTVTEKKGSGALLDWFTNTGEPKFLSKRWFKRGAFKLLTTYVQMVQVRACLTLFNLSSHGLDTSCLTLFRTLSCWPPTYDCTLNPKPYSAP